MTELATVPGGTNQCDAFWIEENINIRKVDRPTGGFVIRHIGLELQGSIYAFGIRILKLGFGGQDSGFGGQGRNNIIAFRL